MLKDGSFFMLPGIFLIDSQADVLDDIPDIVDLDLGISLFSGDLV